MRPDCKESSNCSTSQLLFDLLKKYKTDCDECGVQWQALRKVERVYCGCGLYRPLYLWKIRFIACVNYSEPYYLMILIRCNVIVMFSDYYSVLSTVHNKMLYDPALQSLWVIFKMSKKVTTFRFRSRDQKSTLIVFIVGTADPILCRFHYCNYVCRKFSYTDFYFYF